MKVDSRFRILAESINLVPVKSLSVFFGILLSGQVVCEPLATDGQPSSTTSEIIATPEVKTPVDSATNPAPTTNSVAPTTTAYAGVRVDCVHNFNRNKGASQNCLSVSGLRIGLLHEVNPETRAHLRLDPYGVPSNSMEATPIRGSLPMNKDLSMGLIDFYSVTWSPRPNLDIAVESYGGATAIPSISGLTLLDSLTDEGWKQTAVTLTYNLASANGVRVRFALGNGEGENGKNLDPQQYFGFEVRAPIVQGVSLVGGMSFDGNSVGSDRFSYEQKIASCGYITGSERPTSGYSAQRFGAGIQLDGTGKIAPGFKLGAGWQKATLVDLRKTTKSYPLSSDLATCEQLNPGEIFLESNNADKANVVERTTLAINSSYKFSQSWFAGVDIRQRKISTGDVSPFQACSSFTGSECSVSGNPSSQLKQTAWTLGGGRELSPGLVLDFGYGRVNYDKKYSKFYYLGKNDKATDLLEVFNARVAYNWR